MHPVFYLIEALLCTIYSHDILGNDIGFIPRIFQVSYYKDLTSEYVNIYRFIIADRGVWSLFWLWVFLSGYKVTHLQHPLKT